MKIPFVSFLPMEHELDKELREAFNRVYTRSWYIEGVEDEAFENIMMSLRLEEGLNLKTFYKRYGFNPLEYYKEVLNKHKNDFMIKNDFLICTKREILNTILVDFLL